MVIYMLGTENTSTMPAKDQQTLPKQLKNNQNNTLSDFVLILLGFAVGVSTTNQHSHFAFSCLVLLCIVFEMLPLTSARVRYGALLLVQLERWWWWWGQGWSRDYSRNSMKQRLVRDPKKNIRIVKEWSLGEWWLKSSKKQD